MHAVRALVVAGALAALALPCQAGVTTLSPRLCGWQVPLTAPQQDRLLRVAEIVRRELDGSDHRVALIARSGLNLQRLGIRYSHAGVSLKANADTPWAVRQLYYACEEGRPQLYDQGLAGFLFGTDNPAVGYISIVLLPETEGAALERAALDRPRALRLLAGRYSANAHAFSAKYQNCNQWLVELMASAWGGLDDDRDDLRERAQRWLADRGYVPYPIELGSRALMFAAGFVPWVHLDDHPPDDLFAMRFRTSLPASIEAFARSQAVGARRIELCHDERQVVIRSGWGSIGEGCRAAEGDRTVVLE